MVLSLSLFHSLPSFLSDLHFACPGLVLSRLPWACALSLALLSFSAVLATLSIWQLSVTPSIQPFWPLFLSRHVSLPSAYGCAVFLQPPLVGHTAFLFGLHYTLPSSLCHSAHPSPFGIYLCHLWLTCRVILSYGVPDME